MGKSKPPSDLNALHEAQTSTAETQLTEAKQKYDQLFNLVADHVVRDKQLRQSIQSAHEDSTKVDKQLAAASMQQQQQQSSALYNAQQRDRFYSETQQRQDKDVWDLLYAHAKQEDLADALDARESAAQANLKSLVDSNNLVGGVSQSAIQDAVDATKSAAQPAYDARSLDVKLMEQLLTLVKQDEHRCFLVMKEFVDDPNVPVNYRERIRAEHRESLP